MPGTGGAAASTSRGARRKAAAVKPDECDLATEAAAGGEGTSPLVDGSGSGMKPPRSRYTNPTKPTSLFRGP